MCCMCLLVGSPKNSVRMIGIGGWLHLKSCWVHTQVTKTCFVVFYYSYWGQNVDFPLCPIKQIRIHAVEGRGSPHIYSFFTRICNSVIRPNWSDYGNSFSGIQRIQTDCL